MGQAKNKGATKEERAKVAIDRKMKRQQALVDYRTYIVNMLGSMQPNGIRTILKDKV